MGKSRYSKTKSAGLLCGMSRYKKDFKSKTGAANVALVENRQTRRMKEK